MKTSGNLGDFDDGKDQPTDVVTWLQEWFDKRSDDQWERAGRIKIETREGSGWLVDIDVSGTRMEYASIGVTRSGCSLQQNSPDPLNVRMENGHFKITCGPLHLKVALDLFRSFAQSAT
jgi:hypothetical protein